MNGNDNESLIRDGETAIDFILFETERLYVREFNIDDVEAVFAYAGDAENTVYMTWGPDSREDVVNFIHSRLAHQISSPRKAFDLAVCLKETGELIGAVGLYLTDDLLQGELGYLFNKRFWKNGYAAEAARGMLRFGFLCLDIHRIYAKCDSENRSSEGVMKRIGMRREGEMRSSCHTRVRGRLQWRSIKYYAMLRREYLKALVESEAEAD
jgi:RimJ/RimL family protein N-acetyltransferase